MGKKGDALRALKAEKKVYTFTRTQLEEHDRFVVEQNKERIRKDIKAQVDAEVAKREKDIDDHIKAEWEEREKMFRITEAGPNDGFFLMISLLLAISSRVLIEKFHWEPIPTDHKVDHRNHTAKFADCIIDELNSICNDELKDIRTYCDEVYELYGVRYIQEGVYDDSKE